MAKFRRVVESPGEYEELLDAVETLDLSIRDHYASGTWEGLDGWPCWPSNAEVHETTLTHFKMEIDGEIIPVKPASDDAQLTVVIHT